MTDDLQFDTVVQGGLFWNKQTKNRLLDNKALEPFGYKVYSQNDEDGIIHEIFNRIGTKSKKFIEFGVQNGLESNTHLLLLYGWSGLWIEASKFYFKEIQTRFRPVIKNNRLKVANQFITKDNINQIFRDEEFTGEIDLLSIDIDGNDYYVWEAIKEVDPRVIVIEYNGKFPPDLEWCQAYDEDHIWDISDWQGASLKSLEILGRKKGYTLVGTNLNGVNAFFVRNDLVGNLFLENNTAMALYNPYRHNLKFEINHKSRFCLALQEEGYGILNYIDYNIKKGFSDIEVIDNKSFAWTNSENSVLEILCKKGTTKISIDYYIPKLVLIKNWKYKLTLEVEGKTKNIIFTKSKGSIEFEVNPDLNKDRKLVITFHNIKTFIPSKIYWWKVHDNRKLGIYINLSDIRQYQ